MIKNETIKKLFKVTADVLVYIISILLLITIWFNNNIISTTCITMSILALVMVVISIDSLKVIYKEVNLYYYIVLIIIALSRLLNSDKLFYIGIGLFVLVLLLYILFNFIIKDNKNTNAKEKKNEKK